MQLTKARINAIKDYDTRNLLLGMYEELDALHKATGTNFLQPVNSVQKPASAPPPTASLSVAGANGTYTASITNPQQGINKQLWHELSYSPSGNFSSDVTTLPPTAATQITVPAPGANVHWRIRSSYDQQNWNSYQVHPAVDAGLQTSAAMSPATALNITNYASVDVDSGEARVYGTGGPLTSWVGIKGTTQSVNPSATFIGVTSSNPLIGYDGTHFQIANNLPQLFADNTVPVGQAGTTASPGGGGVTGSNGGRLTAI